jgi:hypothetical protein
VAVSIGLISGTGNPSRGLQPVSSLLTTEATKPWLPPEAFQKSGIETVCLPCMCPIVAFLNHIVQYFGVRVALSSIEKENIKPRTDLAVQGWWIVLSFVTLKTGRRFINHF